MELKGVKVNIWWKLVLLVGIALFSAGVYLLGTNTINPKHLMGLGVGCFLVGLSYFIANNHITMVNADAIVSTERTIHNKITAIMLIIGVAICLLFFVLLIVGLI